MFRQIPNLLSVLRMLLIPVFVWRYAGASAPGDYLVCGVILVVSGITDIMDGLIARRWRLTTDLGKVLDPMADKLTQFTVAIVIALEHPWMWPLPALLAVKDLSLCLGGVVLYRRYHTIKGSRWYGKLATVVYYAVTIALVSFPPLLDARYVWAAVAMVTGAMVFAGAMYAADNLAEVRGRG